MTVGRTARTALLLAAAATLAWAAKPSAADPTAATVPVLVEWYPKISAELVVPGHPPPDHFDVLFSPKDEGVAYTSGTHIVANARWITDNLQGESLGALIHEEVHVVQMPFNRNRRLHYMPGWMLEGTCDVIRWYQFEPVAKRRKPPHGNKVHYDDAYFPAATFLVYVSDKYEKNIVAEVNEASVLGKYSDDLFKDHTGKTLEQLGSEWEKSIGGTGNPHPPTTQPARRRPTTRATTQPAATQPAGR